MAWKTMKLRVSGVAPLIHHCGRLADPTSKVAKAIKEIAGKGKDKTDADYERMAELEFQGSLYMGDDGPIIPAHVLEGAAINGAKKTKSGPKAKAGMYVMDHASLQYEGPRTREGLWADESFRIVAGVRIGGKRIIRTRPIFHNWSAEFNVAFDDQQVNEKDILQWFCTAGIQVGLGDWRPKYGRFTVVKVGDVVEMAAA